MPAGEPIPGQSEEKPKLIVKEKWGTREHEVEKRPQDETFTNLFDRLVKEENESTRQEMFEELDKRVQEAQEKHFFNRETLKNSIIYTLERSTWDETDESYFYSNLVHLARDHENSAQGINDYKEDPRYNGMVEILVMTVADQVSAEGFGRRLPDFATTSEQDEYINTKLKSNRGRETLEKRERVAERARLIGFGHLKPVELVGTRAEEAREAILQQKADERKRYGEREPGIDEEAKEYLKKIAESTEKSEPEIRIEPKENTAEAWVKLIMEETRKAELDSERNMVKTDEDDDSGYWDAIKKAIDRMDDDIGTKLPRDNELSLYYEKMYKEGLGLKELLTLYTEARRKLSNRFVEVERSGGSLVGLGVGREEVAYEKITYGLQDFDPMDWWVLIHGDELFSEYSGNFSDKEKKELLPNVDQALTNWWEVGTIYEDRGETRSFIEKELERIDKTLPGGAFVPCFKESINNSDNMARIRGFLAETLDSSTGEDLAYRLFTAWRTFARFDKEIETVQGKTEDTALIHNDTDRVIKYLKREADVGSDWIVGRIFALPEEKIEGFAKNLPGNKKEIRLNRVNRSRERAVFEISDGGPNGQLVGDFLQTPVFVRDELGKEGDVISRKLESWAIDCTGKPIEGGWKNIPFYVAGPKSYAGYFGYHLQFANIISETLSQEPQRDIGSEERDAAFWNKRKRLLDRLGMISPYLNSAEYDFRGEMVRGILRETGFDGERIKKVTGYSSKDDLLRAGFSEEEIDSVVGRIHDSGDSGVKARAEKESNNYQEYALHKIRLVDALGRAWAGSINRNHSRMESQDRSPIDLPDVRKIADVLGSSDVRYLAGEYLRQFKYEVRDEMSFGMKLGSNWWPREKKRYIIDEEGNIIEQK